ncbi:MAG: hypothetical protein AAF495_04350 [Pseudomonadota bacterium]
MKTFLDKVVARLKFALSQRFKLGKILSVEELSEFIATRAAYVAQTSLFGYLKTRMGTQFRTYFEDDGFSKLIHRSSINLFVSCLSDLTIYSVALIVEARALPADRARALAYELYEAALYIGVEAKDHYMIPADASRRFQDRLEKTVWASALHWKQTFEGSAEDLVRVAPVVDEFKSLDSEIVKNSIRFRWRDIREQLRKRLSAAEVVGSSAGSPLTGELL